MEYTPRPADLTGICLDRALEADLETVARDIHETWAAQRTAQGWRYGPAYDGAAKRHPCLIPYEDLPEAERDVDRATVSQTVRMLIALGYTIERGPGAAAPGDGRGPRGGEGEV